MSIFERYLSLWVALAMVAGICLGNVAPGLVAAVMVGVLAGCDVSAGADPLRARPKSRIFTTPSVVMNRFSGFKSR